MTPLRLGQIVVTLAALASLGCTTPKGLPSGAQLVGGGLQIDYEAPTDGTVILVEKVTGRMVATESLSSGSDFTFGPNSGVWAELLLTLFGVPSSDGELTLQIPTNSVFQLYFVPNKEPVAAP